MQCKLDPSQSLKDMPKKQKRLPPKPLSYYEAKYDSRDLAMSKSYLSGHYTLTEVGEWFCVSYATVSRAVRKHEEQ